MFGTPRLKRTGENHNYRCSILNFGTLGRPVRKSGWKCPLKSSQISSRRSTRIATDTPRVNRLLTHVIGGGNVGEGQQALSAYLAKSLGKPYMLTRLNMQAESHVIYSDDFGGYCE